MELLQDQDVDSLGTLEDRIRQAIELVGRLRRERDGAVREAEAARQQAALMSEELESLRKERQQVRGRIERLLNQIDSLGAA